LAEIPTNFVRERPCVVVLDNGTVHTSRLIKDHWDILRAADIHLFYLPTYSPNLNMIEAIWRQITCYERTCSIRWG
jgi:transposase